MRSWRRQSAVVGGCCVVMLACASASMAASTPAAGVRALYRKVLTAEYFGPASTVCSALTARGKRQFTAGGFESCRAAFKAQQHTLRHKTFDVDESGFTPSGWRSEVNSVMSNLKVTVSGNRASAIGPSGIPGRTRLLKIGGRWLFNTYPPSVQS